MAPAPGPNDLTRQQLDELDALLQRMLGLPLDPPSPPPSPPAMPTPPMPDLPPGWRLDGSHLLKPDPHAAVPLTPAFVPMTAVASVVEASVRRPSVTLEPDNADEPVVRIGPPTEGTGLPIGRTLRGADAPALPSGFRPSVYVEPDPTPTPEPLPTPTLPPARHQASTPASRALPVGLWPLFAVNWGLETVCGLAGPVGAAAVRPAGKQVLGGVGVLLLVAAAAWTARGLGYVDFPVPARPTWWR